jgi:hypothetical protein
LPCNFMTLPVERNWYGRGLNPSFFVTYKSKSTVVVSKTAGDICDAMNRCQMS